ncbi:hypothetical protein ENSA7_64920 [Enhygromyxa salina]|uniref:PIN domain-containing protein n=1 Tax=Enhygromyxa salina TaxID=215803 RepID=A0A2S9Y0D4_9BACT|nr:hypothetical protein ENSA7_64920 [Enhygromyxa salina]
MLAAAFDEDHRIFIQCRQLIEHIVQRQVLLVPAAALGERLIYGDDSLLTLPRLDILSFDIRGARSMADAIGNRAGLATKGYPKKVVKFDAMIIGTCLAHGVELLITHDRKQLSLANQAGLRARDPVDFYARDPPSPQVGLFDST